MIDVAFSGLHRSPRDSATNGELDFEPDVRVFQNTVAYSFSHWGDAVIFIGRGVEKGWCERASCGVLNERPGSLVSYTLVLASPAGVLHRPTAVTTTNIGQ